jgi:penicillin amidase
MQGAWIVPADMNEDGEITGIFFDYVGFDLGDTLGAVERFAQADSVDTFLDETDALFAYAGNFVVADRDGHIAYTSYNATPCRYSLGTVNRNQAQNTPWAAGLDPRYVITGDMNGFEIPNTADGRIDTSFGDDPTKCVIARADWPVNVDPASGYVLNANNDPAGGTFDNSPYNDEWYLGVGYSTGYRADSIDRGLAALASGPPISGQQAGLDAMANLQGNVNSPTARDFLPPLLDALQSVAAGTGSAPALAAYASSQDAMDEVLTRLNTWQDAGMPAESGVDTFYQTHSDEERAQSVATMIYNEWLKAFSTRVFADEELDLLFAPSPNELRLRTLFLMLRSRGDAGNLDGLGSFSTEAGESVFFDDLETPERETALDCIILALGDALTRLSATSNSADVGGFGTTDMSQWLWGLRHQVRFRSVLIEFAGGNPVVDIVAADFNINTDVLPLAPSLGAGDPRADLTWFPRHGDLFAIDAPNFPLTARDYFYSSGPVMRMVFAFGPDGVRGQNILPGGQSGLIDSPHFADQAQLWLANDTIPVRFDVEDVVDGAVGRETFTP